MAKFIAILAVMVDHTNGVLYTHHSVAVASYFSVSLFIFLMGITTFWSYERNVGNLKTKVIQKISAISVSYFLATAVYQVTAYHSFDFGRYVTALINFNASGPFYFVLLYIQLVFVSPFIFYLIKIIGKTNSKRFAVMNYIFVWGGVILLSYFTTNFTNILDIYGGGGKVFGGTYLILLYMGMIFAAYYRYFKADIFLFLIFLALAFGWWRFECHNQFAIDRKVPFGGGFNPPSITSSTMALLLAGVMFNFGALVEKNRVLRKYCGMWAWLGSHTLYIFLYHRYFLDFWLGRFKFLQENIWIKRAGYMCVMIFGSIAIEYLGYGLKKIYARQKTIVMEMTERIEERDAC